MGQPSSEYEYPNQMIQQRVVSKSYVEQQHPHSKEYKAEVKQSSGDKWWDIVVLTKDAIGSFWVFWGFVVGILVIALILFKKEIKKRIGGVLKVADDFVNKE